jgi:hypothetical protein
MESMVNAKGLRMPAVPYIGRAGGGVTPEYRFVGNVSKRGNKPPLRPVMAVGALLLPGDHHEFT